MKTKEQISELMTKMLHVLQ